MKRLFDERFCRVEATVKVTVSGGWKDENGEIQYGSGDLRRIELNFNEMLESSGQIREAFERQTQIAESGIAKNGPTS